jgi:peptidyl-prolyl cis-trans isomerase C
VNIFKTLSVASALTLGLGLGVALAQDGVVAKVGGKNITEADLKLAETEIGQDIANLPPPTKRRVLTEYMIENIIFADAAEAEKLAQGAEYDSRLQYWRRRMLRDLYFEKTVRDSVSDADAKAFYDKQIGSVVPEAEVRARHILVDSKEMAAELAVKIKGGAKFEDVAKENSKDPGSKENGGDLGYFGKGQMVPQFEETAFKMEKGQISEPIQTQFGWHILQLDDKRTKEAPKYEAVKDRIVGSLINQKAQKLATDLREKAKVEFIDAEMKKAIEDEKNAPPAPAAPPPAEPKKP